MRPSALEWVSPPQWHLVAIGKKAMAWDIDKGNGLTGMPPFDDEYEEPFTVPATDLMAYTNMQREVRQRESLSATPPRHPACVLPAKPQPAVSEDPGRSGTAALDPAPISTATSIADGFLSNPWMAMFDREEGANDIALNSLGLAGERIFLEESNGRPRMPRARVNGWWKGQNRSSADLRYLRWPFSWPEKMTC
ncbi:hypothetical protein CYMTET_44241 [Cymbomonas tetramitiformis]|uniref:Uncharacterized protein n=1 Tax=Cymbomonas tetramitiformis TaxID=36881 RepID=A0AAE0C1V3_9CHLO|nr:hypothetical protein CYMTET_44241 [Cymbomonas tetramitiformis]